MAEQREIQWDFRKTEIKLLTNVASPFCLPATSGCVCAFAGVMVFCGSNGYGSNQQGLLRQAPS